MSIPIDPQSGLGRRRKMALTPELVSRCWRSEPNPGPNPKYTPISDLELSSMADALLAERPDGQVWVLGYGSLI